MHSEFFIAFGKLANAFAHMEGEIRRLIAGLAFNDDNVTASAFLDSSQMRGNLRTLEKLARQHLHFEEHFKKIIKEAGKLTDRRNLFIHGIWTPHTFHEGGVALVTDLKTKYEIEKNGDRVWATGQGKTYTQEDFASTLTEIRNVVTEIGSLMDTLSKEGEIEFPNRSTYISVKDSTLNIKTKEGNKAD